MEWQPIDTAPKDGEIIWALEAGYPVGYRDIPRQSMMMWVNNKNYNGGYWIKIDDDIGIDVRPTHWMPLPEPPK